MFDNSRPNVILLTANGTFYVNDRYNSPRGRMFGIARISQELRNAGYEVATIYYANLLSYEELCGTLTQLISAQTLFIGISNWLYCHPHVALPHLVSETSHMLETSESANTEVYEHRMLPYRENLNTEFRKFVKSRNAECRLVLGGPSAADAPWHKGFDYVVIGYAEISVVNLVKHLHQGIPLEKSYRSLHGFTVVNDAKAVAFDFAHSFTKYLPHDAILPNEVLQLEISRGCIFNCAFCGFPLKGKKKLDYLRDPAGLYRELIVNYENHGTTTYTFSDDTFNDSIEKLQMLNEISQKLPFQLEYWAYIRLDLLIAHPESVSLLFDSGLRACYFGIETWNPDTGKIIGKKADKQGQLRMIKSIKDRYGDAWVLEASFIAGLPRETKESLQCTIDTLLSDECRLDFCNMSAFFLKDQKFATNNFISKISQNPEQYGYRVTGRSGDLLWWANDSLDFDTATKITTDFNAISRQKYTKLHQIEAEPWLYLRTYGVDRMDTTIDLLALERARETKISEYRQLLSKNLDLRQGTLPAISHVHNTEWKRFYHNIRDSSWPETLDYCDLHRLSPEIVHECMETARKSAPLAVIAAIETQYNEIGQPHHSTH